MDINAAKNLIKEIKTVQINLHKCICVTSTSVQYMYEQNIDIVLIQEPYLIDKKVALFPLRFQILQSCDKLKPAIVINPKRVKAMILEKHCNNLIVWQ
jgi:hypothetical protein